MSWLVAALMGCAVFVLLSVGVRLLHNRDQENDMRAMQLRTKQHYDAAVERRVRDMRRFRHDAASFLQSAALMAQRDGSFVLDDVSRAPEEMELRLDPEICEGLPVFAAILELARTRCELHGVAFACDIMEELPGVMGSIREGELCSVVQNLLDNALEACLQVEDEACRAVDMRIYIAGDSLCIKVSNSVRSGWKVSFKTTKDDPEHHGVGLPAVKDIAQRHGGVLETNYDGQSSTLFQQVLLPLP